MRSINIDIETYSDVDLKKAGLYKYVQSPNFQILLFGYSIDGGEKEVIDLTQQSLPADVVTWLSDPCVVKHAFNAAFEWYCLNKFYLSPIEQWKCTMVHALYCGLPGSLSAVGEALGLPEDKKKLGTGRALIRTFCVPCKPSKTNGNRTRTLPQHEPEKWQLFKQYNLRDVETEMTVLKLLAPFAVPEKEWALWRQDIMMNAGGIACDTNLVGAAIQISQRKTSELMGEAKCLTGVDNPKSIQQLTAWLEDETEEEIPDLQKETVKTLIDRLDSIKAKRVLSIRQELGKTSVKKYQAMANTVGADGRIRGLMQFYGANRTGRWAGRLVQVQNLPKNHIPLLETARECVLEQKTAFAEILYGSIPEMLSQLIRTAFVPSPGHKFVVSDFSAIEARVIAWLAGESWRQKVFATHGRIYEASASAMFGVPIERIVKGNPEYELRQKGKVAELALGYQGSSGALISMGALRMGLQEDELPDIVSRWRKANPRIVDLWYAIERAAFSAMQTGSAGAAKDILFQIESANGLNYLTIRLPSQRKLYYLKPFVSKNTLGRDALYYHGVDQKTGKHGLISTYGGKLTENIVQAIARDCLADNILKLYHVGYQIVMHIHDEIVAEVPSAEAETALYYMNEYMSQPIDWAPGLLLGAEGFISDYYKKE